MEGQSLQDARWLAELADNLMKLATAARRMEERVSAGAGGMERREARSPFEAAVELLKRNALEGREGSFRRQGDIWRVHYDGVSCGLRHVRGLSYLALLLRHPGVELHAAQIVELTGGFAGERVARDEDLSRTVGLGDAGRILDRKATEAYRRRLAELRQDIEDADAENDFGRAAHRREEMALLADALATAGRDRRAASHAERARVTVTKGIKNALERVHAAHPGLGRHLRASIRRGYFCSYDPGHPVDWVVETS
jgi:hypothetical protein